MAAAVETAMLQPWEPLVREGNQVRIRKHDAFDAKIVQPSEVLHQPSLSVSGELAITQTGNVQAVEKCDAFFAR